MPPSHSSLVLSPAPPLRLAQPPRDAGAPPVFDGGEGELVPSAPPPLTMSVLIIEDDPSTRDVVGQALREEGCWVTRAASAHEALHHLERHPFEAAILDLGLPDMDGLALLSRIRERHRDVSVIVLTGLEDPEVGAASARLGAFSFRKKPADFLQLRRDLERIADRYAPGPNLRAVLQVVGGNVKRWRKERRLKLRDVSERSGLSVSMLSQIEHAATSLSIAALVRLATVLRKDVGEFFLPPDDPTCPTE